MENYWLHIGYMLFIFSDICFTVSIGTNVEVCIADVFQPQCSPGEIILMENAKYGRMKLGVCFNNDLGYLGCNSDVLPQFDELCSGMESCHVLISDKSIKPQGGCIEGLIQYLEASYVCLKGMSVSQHCSSNDDMRLQVQSKEAYISSGAVYSSCLSNGRTLTLFAAEGQLLNISMIDLETRDAAVDDIYGTLKDPTADKRILIGKGHRKRHLMTTVSNAVEVSLQSSSRFILHVSVCGCPNVVPPDGAWITRDGDVMEIGCHSGEKSWSLTCEDSQWVGAVGQCGTHIDGTEVDQETDMQKLDGPGISSNVMVFGSGSFIILISSVIFMVGVCILKRKLTPKSKSGPEYYGHALGPGQTKLQEGNMQVIQHHNYKSLKLPLTPTAVNVGSSLCARNPQSAYPTYMNSARSDAGDSVTYYVLEDGVNEH